MGILAFILLWGGSAALRKSVTPNEGERVAERAAQSPFDGHRAHGLVESLHEANLDRAAFLARHLADPGFSLQRLEWEIDGQTHTHLLARRAGTQPGHILLVTPYEPARAGLPGAIGTSSGAALLLELARVLPRDWCQRTVWLLFLSGAQDAREAQMDAILTRADAARAWKRGPTAALYLEGVGDCYLALSRDRAAPPALVDLLWDTAYRFLLSPHFRRVAAELRGPAAALRAHGIGAAALADQVHGGSIVEHERLWRSAEDTPDRVCAESLQAVGDVLYHSILAIDGLLDGLQGAR